MENVFNQSKAGLIRIFVFSLLILGIYYSTFEWLVVRDWARDDYSHGMIVPFIVLYLLWEKKNILSATPVKMSWLGFLALVPGIMLFWIGELSGEFFLLYMSCWLIVVGLCWIHLGVDRLKVMAFPLLISIAMFPLPNLINVKLTFQLRLISSKLGVLMLQFYGMSAYREGNVIDLGFTKLQVVDACSGLRYLFPLLILSILIAYFYRSRWWKKAVIVLLSVPLTIFTNSLRIALTGILSQKYGSVVIEGFFHDFEGWFIFMISLGALLAVMWGMNRLFPEHARKSKTGQVHSFSKGAGLKNKKSAVKFWYPQFIISTVLLVATLALSQGIDFREAIPTAKTFDNFPLQVNQWRGTRQDMEEIFIDALDFNDYIMADYTNEKGRQINFYVAYYESQRKGESIHSPNTCLRGGGWKFRNAGKTYVLMHNALSIPVSKAYLERGSVKQVAYYWFPSRGRNLTNAYEMKWFNFWDALTRQRTDGALVRLITHVYPGEKSIDAEKRLQDFTRSVKPVLSKFLPQ